MERMQLTFELRGFGLPLLKLRELLLSRSSRPPRSLLLLRERDRERLLLYDRPLRTPLRRSDGVRVRVREREPERGEIERRGEERSRRGD